MTADYDVVGINACMNANRISWFFDLHGTSMNVDTACSSSLVAMDLAFQGLQSGDANLGIVAGTDLILSPDMMQVFSNVNMLSPDSRSYSFDHRSNGYGRGEGTGTLIMKRLSDAIRDGDTVRAIVRSTGSNSDGLTPSGIMQPGGASQARLIQQTYAKAGLSMKPTRFFEAHGTGTPVGDPIECNAIGSAFRGARKSEDPLIVGSVKANIGHLEGASGIAAVIKTIMILERGLIPPQASYEKVNPKIDLEFLNLKFPVEPTPWPVLGLRRASVNSFGFGGSNAHVILDDAFHFLLEHDLKANHNTVEYPPMLESSGSSASGTDTPAHDFIQETPTLLTLQSATKAGIREVVKKYKDHFGSLEIEPSQFAEYLESLSYTLNVRRSELNSRSFCVASNLNDLQVIDSKLSPVYQAIENPSVGFVFTGQGAQWPEMGRELWGLQNFRNTMIQCEDALRSFGCSWSLREELLLAKPQTRIDEPEIAQPANTALQIALINLLSDIGISCAASIGHSSGEIAAAYAVGALNLYDSMKIAYFRGLYASQLAKSGSTSGGMIAVGLSAEKTQEYIDQISESTGRRGIIVACVNSQKSVTVSGDRDQIDMLETLLQADNVFARKLKIPVAYHSSHMRQVADLYRESMKGICNDLPKSNLKSNLMISSVTGESVQPAELSTPDYWVSNLVSPVQFTKAFFGICTDPGRRVKKLDYSHRSKPGVNILLEIGPHSALQGPIRDMLAALLWGSDVSYSPVLRRGENATKNLLEAIGQLSCLGLQVDMEKVSRLSNPQIKHPRVLVDLPMYPFNHSTSYWRESRTSKRSRFEKGRMDLLGKLVPDSHALEARWRNNIRLTEMPWVEDHIINGTLIYPAAGMLVMAFEAASQMADPELPIAGFEVKDVRFQRALTIPRTAEGIETNFQLRTIKDNGKAVPWMHFRLFSYDHDAWEENCHGYIRVEYESANVEEERRKTLDVCMEQCTRLESTCTAQIADSDVYARLKQSGFEFGPTFQTVTGAKCNGGNATGTIKVFQWAEHLHPQAHVIHPTTLDGILHLSSAGLAGQSNTKIPTAIPTGIKSLWVAQDGINGLSSDKIQASASLQSHHKRGHEFDIYALSEHKDGLLARVKGLQSTIVAQHADTEAEAGPVTAHRLKRVLDPDTMSLPQLIKFCGETKPSDPEPVEYFRDLNFICYKFLQDAATAMSEAGPLSVSLLPHVQQYTNWAALQKEKYNAGTLPLSRPEWSEHLQSEEYFEAACERIASTNQGGAAYVRTGRHLLNVLRGEQDPLKFLFSDSEDMMVQWYSEVNERPVCFNPWGRYLQTLAQKNPTMKILEIGAGTGGSTAHILKALSTDTGLSEDGALYMSYDYTDISPAFFERAKERFAKFPRLRFQTLDIQKEPAEQEFDLNSYDLIVAANVLHATSDMRKTMKNVHKLLKPDGRLMLFEITHPEIIRSGFIAGLMEGWWAGGNDGRVWSPALTVNDWDVVLKETGFSGVDITFPEFENVECHEMDIIVASANNLKSTSAASSQPAFYFLMDPLSDLQLDAFSKARDALMSEFPESKILSGSLEECASANLTDVTVVCLVESERPLLSGMDRKTFTDVQKLATMCNSLLWVTGGGGEVTKVPEYGLVDGWARVLRSEKTARRICTLALDLQETKEVQNAQIDHIVCVIQQSLFGDPTADYEPEFVEIDEKLHILRVETHSQLTADVHVASQTQKSDIQFITDLYAAQLACKTPGLLTSLHWVDGGLSFPLQPDEVYIKPSAVGTTYHDVMIMQEKIPETQLGLECAGEVFLAGELSGFQPGDRVVAFGPGKFRTDIKVKADFVCQIPTEISLNHAAGLPMSFGIAWHLLMEIGRLRKGQKVLIHAGAGALGQAAIQLAQYIGAEIFATVSSDEKKQWLIEKRGLSAEHIFRSRDTFFASEVMRATQGRGVNVVINHLGGEVQSASWDCVGPYGHLIQVGHQTSTGSIPLSDLGRQAAFVYFDSVVWARDRPDMLQEAIQNVLPLCAHGHLDLVSFCKVSNANSIEDVFRSMQDETAIGKSVIDLTETVAVPTLLEVAGEDELDSDATYVIAGGLGGLGQASARWMVAHGARYLVLLGRSGPSTKAAQNFIDELIAEGVTVQAPPCDVIDTAAVQKVIEEVTKTMPTIKGCIQGSGLLRDGLFSDMRYEDWRTVAEVKCMGSKNLAEALPRDMDFFVMLSSVSGIAGIVSQSNYNAGNAYMDQLARYLTSRGQNAISLDLGPMVDDGMLLATTGLLDQVLGYGILTPVNRNQYLTLLAHACRPENSKRDVSASQIIYGLPSRGQRQNNLPDIPIFRRLKLESSFNGQLEASGKKEDFKSLFSKASSLKEGREVVASALLDKMVHSYQLIPEDTEIDKDAPLHTYRVDSLLAVEMCNWIAKEFVAELAVLEVMGGASFSMVELLVATRSQIEHPQWS